MKSKYLIHIVVGARPQIMKAAALANAMQDFPCFEYEIIHSGQHYDKNLSADFFAEFNLKAPKYNFEIGSKGHNVFIANFLLAYDPILQKEQPDLVIVVGDTNTTAAAAIAASKLTIPLAHVEAGLREWDKSIPEEINKILTDAVSDLFFSPTITGVKNLAKQGVIKNVYHTGDITLDLLSNGQYIWKKEKLRAEFGIESDYVFVTCHRVANTENQENLRSIVEALTESDKYIIWSMHPRTEAALKRFDLWEKINQVLQIIPPQSYKATQSLIKYAEVVVTDSGGIIKEAYFHKRPGIIIDTQTEWVETIIEGWNVLAGPSKEKIVSFLEYHTAPVTHKNSLGNGTAGKQILNVIKAFLDC